MRDLVQHGVADELGEVAPVARPRLERTAEQRDPVGEDRREDVALRPGHPLVEPEEDLVAPTDRIGRRDVGDGDLHVGEVRQEVLGQRRHRVVDEACEPFDAAGARTVDGTAAPVDVATAVAGMAFAHAGTVAARAHGPAGRATSLPNHIRVVYRPRVPTALALTTAAVPSGSRSHRACIRPGCGQRATSTLRFDYAARTVMLDPIGPVTGPGEYDLCVQHAARSGPPSGWTLRDRAPSHAPATEPAPPVGPDRGQRVARLAAALSAVPRSVSEDALDAAPVGTDRSVGAATAPVAAARPQGTSRLDGLLQPSDRGPRPATVATRTVPVSERPPEAEVRRVPQPLRLAPDPTTTVWCADLLGGAVARDDTVRDIAGSGEPTLFV